MPTRAIIGVHAGEQLFVGRYVHQDGYPGHMLPHLHLILRRDKPRRALDVLLSRDWSQLSSTVRPQQAAGVDGYGFTAGSGEDPAEVEAAAARAPMSWGWLDRDVTHQYVYLVDHVSGVLNVFKRWYAEPVEVQGNGTAKGRYDLLGSLSIVTPWNPDRAELILNADLDR